MICVTVHRPTTMNGLSSKQANRNSFVHMQSLYFDSNSREKDVTLVHALIKRKIIISNL